MNSRERKDENFQATRRKWRGPVAAAASMILGAAIGLQTSEGALAQYSASAKPVSKVGLATAKDQPIEAFGGYGGGAAIPEPVVPPGTDLFNLTLEETKLYSRSMGFEVVGHSYFKGPWLTQAAQAAGLGASFNTPRVYDGIFYGAGYSGPAILFGTLIADVHDPLNMEVLSFIPCQPGTRCPYLRVNPDKKILASTHDTSSANPNKAVGPVQVGVSFHDVSDPRNPKPLSFVVTKVNALTHGMEMDDRYVYACAEMPLSRTNVGANYEVVIIDYDKPTSPQIVGTFHVEGQHIGETFAPLDQFNPDGTPQKVYCHEIFYAQDRLYVAYRDAGAVILDVTDRKNPVQIGRYDWVPPYNGGGLGAAHSVLPLIPNDKFYPTLAVTTDENFSCPSGFGRVLDISNLSNIQVLSTIRIPATVDNFDFPSNSWICPSGGQTTHLPWLDFRSSSLLYQSWYAQGVRAFDLTNPYEPREIGWYLSPPYPQVRMGYDPRHTREVYQDPDSALLYMTDGSGGGLTILRWTGSIPKNRQIPGAR